MSQQLLKKIEGFRKAKGMPILTLCKMMDVHNVTYHRWRNAGKITGAYKKLVEAFLAQNDPSITAVNTPTTLSQNTSSDIAVIGIACYYPGASNVRELWENILARRVQFRRMLDQRLPLSEYYSDDPKATDKTYLTKAAFLENFIFDWGKLRIPKKTVESTDIAHWLALDIALKTFEDAGFNLNDIPLQNTGVIVGNTLTGEQTRSQTLRMRWPYVQKALNATLNHLGKGPQERSQIASEMEKIYKSAFYPVTEDSLAGGLANTIAGRICNYLNLKGGGYIVDGACSSSLLAVATAADALKMGNMDLALAGGVDISLDPFELVGFSRAGALSKDQMRVYDQKANGFLPGEGCGFVLLKRLNDAIRDKNYVYAVIKGWGISSDGKGGIMEPSSSGQSFAIGRAYKDLNYKISDVDFVEGHGTGTTKGDRVELEGIAAAIDKTINKEGKKKRGCGVTSFKSIVGHTKAAAGVGGLIKAIMAVNQRILPPTANCTQPNDVFKDKALHMYPIMQGGKLPVNTIARAGISSAGFGGINCHVTVESKDPPKKELKPKLDESALFVSQQETEVFVFTSRTIIHLKKIIEKFKTDLRNISLAEMADLATLLNKKVKNRLPIKAAIVTDTPEHLYEALVLLENEISNAQIEEGEVYRIKAKDMATQIIFGHNVKKNRIGFLYPGQGSQRLNMTRTIVERYDWAKDLFKLSKLPLFESIYLATDKFLTKEEQQDFEKGLADTRITQPAIVLASLIWTEFFSKLGIEPQLCLGHSLGELTAFYKAAAFNKETLLKFAQYRGELMSAESHSSGSMISLFCSKEKAEELILKASGNIVIANINSPNQIIFSGGKKEIEKISELAQKEKIPAYRLNVSNAFHSSFMKEASAKIQKNKILPDEFKSRDIKVYSCVSAAIVKNQVNLKEYFSTQVISPVNFVGTIEAVVKEACDVLIELGPGKVLTDLVRAIDEKILCLPVESLSGNDRDLNIVLAELFVRNVPIQWEELYKNRLIKTFVPASRKKFIENQCEHPLKLDKHILESSFSPILLEVKDEKSSVEEIISGGLPATNGKEHIADLLINLTHKMTGFSLDTISLNLTLLDDLNLDSIKAAELIGQAARSLGIPGQVDPSQMSNNSLEQICDRLYVITEQSKAGVVKESLTDILKRYQDKTWVRNFTQEFRPEEITTKNVNQLKALENVFIVSETSEKDLSQDISDEFKSIKSKVRKSSFDDLDLSSEKIGHIDCLIAVLPRQFSILNKDSLKSIIQRLQKVTELATSKHLNNNSFVVFIQFGGGSTAIASTLFLERPELKVRIIDVDPSCYDANVAVKIIDELQTYEDFNSVRYDSQLARQVVYYENSKPEDYKKREIKWSSADVVIVTGGAKGITAQCALEFARSTKAHMVLIGRSPLPIDYKDVDNEIVQTLNQFTSEDLKCSYYNCDVSNNKEVVNTIEEIEKKLGKITGFVHGAGLNSLRRLKQANVKEVLQESLPKVMGAINICQALESHPPKLIVGITSIIGLTGMESSGWYGLANEILNLYLNGVIARSNPQKSGAGATKKSIPQLVNIAYSVWDEVGMGAKLGSVNRLAEKGIGAIPVKEGIKHFKQLIESDPGCQQVIVAARVAGIATWKSSDTKPNNFRFLEKIEYLLPGIELIARANLNVDDDPYLLDHDWKGSLLFPFVFGFEAMAQAVAHVLGIEQFDYIKARDINLQRPIPVPQDSGTTIEIHAQVFEVEKNNNNFQVRVEIYSQETAYKEPHFSAIFELGVPAQTLNGVIARSEATKQSLSKKSINVIDIDVKTNIYGPILFQGKLFQCIEQIHELYYDEKTQKGECIFTSIYNKSAEGYLVNYKKFNNIFLIGDPFFIDTLLQSMQIIIPQDISLPRDINEIEISLLSKNINTKCLVHSNIKRLDADHYRGDAEFLNDNISIKIKNCRLKVLDTVLSNPSANDLVNPASRDQKIIENRLIELSQELGFTPPVIKCAYDKRLINASKDLRHKIETPLIKSAVLALLKKDGKTFNDIKIKWLKTGRLVVEGLNLKGVNVSLSHSDSFLIVAVGFGEQGVDFEIIKERNNNEWLDILGEERYDLLKEKEFYEHDQDRIGTSIWSTIEVLHKIAIKDFKLDIVEIKSNEILFKAMSSQAVKTIICTRIKSALNNNVLLSFVINSSTNINPLDAEVFNELGYDRNIFKSDITLTGPDGQVVYVQRFPITFKNVQSLGKKVYFSNYFSWIGDVREYSLYPIRQELIKFLESGKWGMATNHVKLQILGNLKTDDLVEVRLWADRILGDKDSVLDLKFDWFKVLPNGKFERVAFSEQRVSWIEITGHGEGRVESFPASIKKFVNSMRPLKSLDAETKRFSYPTNLLLGDEIESFSLKKPLLRKEIFSTSLEESNLVGNIYFANYGKWLGKIEDCYFFEKYKNSYIKNIKLNELFCTNCEIYHLKEAMPYDKIIVNLYLEKVYKRGVALYFEFFKESSDSHVERLAYAEQTLVWGSNKLGSFISEDFPLALLSLS